MRIVHIAVEGILKDEEDNPVICPLMKDGGESRICSSRCAWFSKIKSTAYEDMVGKPLSHEVMCFDRVIGVIAK